MFSWHRSVPAGLLLLLTATWGYPQVGPEEAKKEKAPSPGGASDVILLVDQIADALKMVPRAVMMSSDKHRELLAELERLRKQAESDQRMLPSECAITGKLESSRLQLTLRFGIVPYRAGSVWLACGKKMHVTRATLDGAPAPLRADSDGLHVYLEAGSKERIVQLEVTVPVQLKGGIRSVELDLPGAAITDLDLEIPPGLQDLRLNDVLLTDSPLVKLRNNRLVGPLGVVEKWTLSWREPQVVAGPMVQTAVGNVEVTVDERQHATTLATLNLHLESGRTSSWRLLLPPGAELKLPAEFESRVAGIDTTDVPFACQKVIRLKEATSDPLTVTIQVPAKGPMPRGSRVPVGPFIVQGALRQTGSITVRSTARDVQLRTTLPPETTPRVLDAEQLKQALFVRGFRYERVPVPEDPKTATGPGSYSLLDLEAETVRGQIETRVSHVLRLPRRVVDSDEPRLWEITTTLKGRLIQPGVELLEIELPAGAQHVPGLSAAPRSPIQEVRVEPMRNVLQLRLDRDGWKDFTFTFKVRTDLDADPAREATILLPRPLETERTSDFQVQVIVPDDLELGLPEKPNPTLDPTQTSPQEQTWKLDVTADRLLEEIVLAWRPFRPEIQANATIDLTLTAREARLRHEIRLRLPRQAQRLLLLRLPDDLPQPPQILSGGKPVAYESGDPQIRAIQVDAPTDQEAVVVLDYHFFLPAEVDPLRGREAFTIPLIVPEQATNLRTHTRVWANAGTQPIPDGPGWVEQPLEEVAGRRRLPALVLRSDGTEQPLRFRYAASEGNLPAVVARRALVRVLVQEGQGQFYQVSYLLQQISGTSIEVEMPAALLTLSNVVFTLDGNQLDPEVLDDNGERNDGGRVARIRLPLETQTRPSLLEITYLMTAKTSSSPVTTLLQPPLLRGEPGQVVSRWAISLPSNWIVLGPEEGPGTRRSWVRRGALLVSRPGESLANLEAWLAGTDTTPQEPVEALASPALVCWRSGICPLTVYHAPQQIWLLVCSLSLLALGLGLVFWWRRLLREEESPYILLLVLVLLALVPSVLSLWFPTGLSAVVVGCQPGLAVLLLVVLIQWWAHERERRQLTYLSSFSRDRRPSTVSRPQTNPPAPVRPQAEPSTVDVPPGSGT